MGNNNFTMGNIVIATCKYRPDNQEILYRNANSMVQDIVLQESAAQRPPERLNLEDGLVVEYFKGTLNYTFEDAKNDKDKLAYKDKCFDAHGLIPVSLLKEAVASFSKFNSL